MKAIKRIALLAVSCIVLSLCNLGAKEYKEKPTCNTCKVLTKQFQELGAIPQREIHKKVCTQIQNKNFEEAAQNLLKFLPKEVQSELVKSVQKVDLIKEIEELKELIKEKLTVANSKKIFEKYLQLIRTSINNIENHFLIVAPIIASPLIIVASIYAFIAITVQLIKVTGGIVAGTTLAVLCSVCIMVFCDFVLFADFVLFSCKLEAFIPLVVAFITYKVTKKIWNT